jgi:magnesium-transporting ATPase (P-type)
LQKNETLSAQGYRVLLLPIYKVSEQPPDNFMHDLVFLGLIAFSDPPRKNVIHAIQPVKKQVLKQ